MHKIKVQNFTPTNDDYQIEVGAHKHPWSLLVFSQSYGPTYYNRQLTVNDEPVGYIICQQVLDELTILNIAIDPKYQGQGLSHHLMQDTLSYARKNSMSIFLEVRVSNTIAIHLYQKYGFRELAQRSDYYKAHNGYEDALIMKWSGEMD